MIAIVKGCGTNIASIQFALDRLQQKSLLTSDRETIQSASHVILPGVGTAGQTMQQLSKLNLLNTLRELKQPVMGICLGMQIMYEQCDEGSVAGLGVMEGLVSRMSAERSISIPHMGWNQLEVIDSCNPLMKNIDAGRYVFYVHSYAAPVTSQTVAKTKHGNDFTAVVNYKNFYGVQFHPERSGEIGEIILKNFVEI